MAASPEIESARRVGEAGPVGREPELETFGMAFDRMLGGRRQILTIAGEPGIGKTRLAEAAAQQAEDRGALVLWGGCYEEAGAPPYWPWVQILRALVGASSARELSRLAGTDGSEIATLVPELGGALGFADTDAQTQAPSESSQTRFRSFDAIAGFLRRTTEQVPLVLIIENAHWADRASLSMLEFLSQDLVSSRLLVVLTYRDTEISRQNPLLGTLGALGSGDGATRLKLRGLDSAGIAALAARTLNRPLPAVVIEAIDQQTDGNPLFVIELLKVLIEESGDAGIEPIEVRIPDGVRETIGRRLSRLSVEVNDLLRAAAVIGREFDAAVLARMTGVDIAVVIEALDLAVRAGFVEATDRAIQTYRFSHALIRETLYDELTTPERIRFHGLAGDALASLYPDQRQNRLSQIAHHYFESAAFGQMEQAVDYSIRAGHEAMRLDAYDEAGAHYGNVVRLLRQSGFGGAARLREAIYWQLRALTATGIAEAVALIGPALEDPELAADDAWLADIVAQWVILTSYSMQVESLPLLRRVGARLPETDSSARAKVLAAQALAERTLGNVARVQGLIDESIAMARRLGDADTLNWCLRTSLVALASCAADIDLRIRLGDEFIATAPPGNTSERLTEALYQQASNLIEAGRIDGVYQLVEQFEGLNASRFGFQEYRARALRVVLALVHGEYEGLVEAIEALRAVGHKTRGGDADGVYGVQMFMLNRDLGRLPALGDTIERIAAAQVNRTWTPGLMLALTEIGRLEAAGRELERLAVDDFSRIPIDALRVPTLAYCAETCAALGDARRARVLYDLLLPYAATFATHHVAVCLGSTERYLGMLAATMGELEQARGHFERAMRANSAGRAWPWLVRTSHQYALALRRTGTAQDLSRAEELLRDAEQLAGSLGMEGLTAEIGLLLRGNAGARYPDELTAREVDVLRLITIGRSNKDIAQVLSISLNTVATHVRNILTKTECANRTEAAAYARRNDLVE
jgi:DNA-binding CsgD family transcriptional regulator